MTTSIVDTKNPRKVEAGRKGGNVTLQKHGREQLRDWGKLGGRPRNPTYDDIRQRQLLEQNKNNNKEVTDPPGDLSHLRKLYKLRRGSSAIPEIVQAGTANETPRERVPAGKGSGH
jgi:hypothetical protein